jgi:hypothetical protein
MPIGSWHKKTTTITTMNANQDNNKQKIQPKLSVYVCENFKKLQ